MPGDRTAPDPQPPSVTLPTAPIVEISHATYDPLCCCSNKFVDPDPSGPRWRQASVAGSGSQWPFERHGAAHLLAGGWSQADLEDPGARHWVLEPGDHRRTALHPRPGSTALLRYPGAVRRQAQQSVSVCKALRAPPPNAVKRFDVTRLASPWLSAPRKCARSRSERPRTATTQPLNP
jgi:hypothetical protein